MKLLHYCFPLLCKLNKNCINIERFSHFTSVCISHGKRTFLVTTSSKCCTFIHSFPFHTSTLKCAKQFQERENEHAHNAMVNLSGYSNSLLKYPLHTKLTFSQTKNCNIFDKFANATTCNIPKGLTLENAEFSQIVKGVCSSLPHASDDEIQNILHCLCLWPPTRHTTTPNYKLLWNTLDEECTKRMKNWDVGHKLLIGDYWFHLKLSRISRYNRSLITDLIHSIEILTNQQVIQLMFFINLQRKIPLSLVEDLEKKLHSIVNLVTIEEVGVICLGFFKTQNKITNPDIIQLIVKKFLDNVEHTNTITIASILKFLRKSLNMSLIDLYILVLHRCIPHLNNMDIPTSVHLALLSSETNVYHPLLLNYISDKLAKQISQVRLKDCTKLLHCLSHFNHESEGDFHKLHIAEMVKEERRNEIASMPRDIIYSLLYYAYLGYFNYDLLAKMFEKHFIEMSCLKYDGIACLFAEVDYCIEVECPDYIGPRLDISMRQVLENRRGNIPHKSTLNLQTRLLKEVYESLEEIFGSNENILIRHILPHVYTPDVIVRLFNKTSETLADFCNNITSDCVLKPPIGEVWACFVVTSSYSFAYKSKHITGLTSMKLRQLKKLGYHVIFLPFYDVPTASSQRAYYLKKKLNLLEKDIIKQNFSYKRT